MSVRARLAPPAAPAMPGDYDFARYAWFLGLGAVGFAHAPPHRLDAAATAPAPVTLRWLAAIERLRQHIGERIAAALPGETGAIAAALITGERGGISETTNDVYRDSGLFHILSISGLHMAIMGGAVFWIVRLLLALFPSIALSYPTKKWAALAAIAGSVGYLAISGYCPHLPRHTIRFFSISCARKGVTRNCSVATMQIGFGLSGTGASGLIYGTALGQCASIFALARNGFWRELTCGWYAHKAKFVVLAQRYRNFPRVSTPSSFINAAVAQLPLIVLAAWFDIRVIGLYALGVRVLQVPARFIGDSLTQVFFSMAADAHRSGTLKEVASRTWRVQTTFALYSFLPLAVVSPELFSVAFGHEWREGGVYTQLLLPWTMTSFISASLSILVTVLQKQKQEFIFQIIYISVLPCSLWWACL